MFGTVSVVIVVISGGIFPMDIFGEKFAFVMGLLPFGYTTQFPSNIINGRFDTVQIATGLLCQLFWIVLLFFAGKVMWKRGLHRFAAVGG